ncbi:hypothetical protein [Mycolicibacterium celeriflavum]|uniref:Uncharacterized protein n=1 Tax=Mycolicibacterium celeriflavum TaxID=1249101 RepID=A0A1X0BN88_MYCCF|nr:hypothetical protein [Mycolicibacterium celeriflavum]MCV7240245.1 hypothetical protein [Mycolicibacterium celeriflavum]ORA44413.1 hypothetical protein BST21_19845 [Mycolicibacterium celeriflavum]BBY44409.1 hypothetical protein MCEL_27040 [Mycolicibacterium celeriflavum]
MTGPEDDHSNTRPISVAELLARNGTIGAPPIGGRRRRRRGDTDSITVAELTGEIPIVRDDDDAPATGRSAAAVVDAPAEAEEEVVAAAEAEAVEAEPEPLEAADPEPAAEAAASNGAVDHVDEVQPAADDVETEAETADEQDEYADAVADYQTHVEQRETDEDLDFFAPPRRSHFARRRFGLGGRSGAGAGTDTGVGAEQMSPDPLDWSDPKADEEDAAEAAVDLVEPEGDDREDLPSYLRSRDSDSALFGGPGVADEEVRRDNDLGPEDIDLEDDADVAPSGPMSAFLRGAWVVAQCVIAVAFGAGLFIAFDQLWKWNSIIALVLGVLVILGLVVGVRVVRKTEDIGSTLIAVAVGAMVTFGPLALMQAG